MLLKNYYVAVDIESNWSQNLVWHRQNWKAAIINNMTKLHFELKTKVYQIECYCVLELQLQTWRLMLRTYIFDKSILLFSFTVRTWIRNAPRVSVYRLETGFVLTVSLTDGATVSPTGAQERVAVHQHMQLETCACTSGSQQAFTCVCRKTGNRHRWRSR